MLSELTVPSRLSRRETDRTVLFARGELLSLFNGAICNHLAKLRKTQKCAAVQRVVIGEYRVTMAVFDRVMADSDVD